MIPRDTKETVANVEKQGLDFATEQGLNMRCGWQVLGKAVQDALQAVAESGLQ